MVQNQTILLENLRKNKLLKRCASTGALNNMKNINVFLIEIKWHLYSPHFTT